MVDALGINQMIRPEKLGILEQGTRNKEPRRLARVPAGGIMIKLCGIPGFPTIP